MRFASLGSSSRDLEEDSLSITSIFPGWDVLHVHIAAFWSLRAYLGTVSCHSLYSRLYQTSLYLQLLMLRLEKVQG